MKFKIFAGFIFICIMGYFILDSNKTHKKNQDFIKYLYSLSLEEVKEIQIVRSNYNYKKGVKSQNPLVRLDNSENIVSILKYMKTEDEYLANHRPPDDSVMMLLIGKNNEILVHSYLVTYDDKDFVGIHYYFQNNNKYKSLSLYQYFNDTGLLDGYNFKY